MLRNLILTCVLFFPSVSNAEVTLCEGEYALCAASTCTPTGKTITPNNGVPYPEVICKCPILHGPAIADLTAGNMQGSCEASAPGHVWSLFFPRMQYRQEANNFSRNPLKKKVVIQECGSELQQGYNASNCFSFDCEKGPDGVAICRCPMGQQSEDTAFLTEAGQGNPDACFQHPVSLPLPSGQ
jgi:hypothetical protein